VFVWVFHRISGVLLIFLLFFEVLTGFFQGSTSNLAWVKSMAGLHKHTFFVSVLVFLIIFHASYGVRTILMDFGIRREKLLFWVCTAVATVLFGVFLILFGTLVSA
jgi:succinate dehydrogenase/fumarate reductase cytochrome b subunit